MVVGETPNLAARLQALAAPNTLVIGEATRRQVGRLFELADLGPQALAGFAKPIGAGQRQQLHQQGDVAGLGRRREQRRQAVEFCLGFVFAHETGSSLQLCDQGVERAVLMAY